MKIYIKIEDKSINDMAVSLSKSMNYDVVDSEKGADIALMDVYNIKKCCSDSGGSRYVISAFMSGQYVDADSIWSVQDESYVAICRFSSSIDLSNSVVKKLLNLSIYDTVSTVKQEIDEKSYELLQLFLRNMKAYHELANGKTVKI